MSLATYHKKRDFKQTREPRGETSGSTRFRFVVQEHHASRLHYDFRLELGGTLKSWAVPKGPEMDPGDKRLAVHVEDHPVSYIDFKGIIPKGNYGAGTVKIWDKGTFQPINEKSEPITEKEALQWLSKGELKFSLEGKKLKGEYVLVDMKKDEKNWLLIRHKNNVKGVAAPVPSIKYGRAKKIPDYVHPMLASLSKSVFDDPDWIYEIKWDGYRAISVINKDEVKFYSRNGVDFSERFRNIYTALSKFKKPAIIDGEIVLFNESGLPDFQKLQNYEAYQDLPIQYIVFDMLELDGKDMRKLTLIQRKEILKKYLGRNKLVKFCDHIEGKGTEFLQEAKATGLEGIIAKAKDSTYTENYRSKQWLKLKNVQSTEAIIVGYTEPKGSRSHFGSLVLAGKKGKELFYRGHVGTGFNEKRLDELKTLFKPLETGQNPFNIKVPLNGAVTWLEPTLLADIAYTEITREGIFRHPVFLRLRDDKTVKSIHDESKDPGMPKGNFTNTDKVFWPKEGYTKGNLIAYYNSISPYILPHLKDRPLSLKRNPNGILDAGFFHKDAGENAPDFVKTFPVESASSQKTIDYIVCNNLQTLLYLANLGCIEMNPWNSTIQKPDFPTWLVIDIDPSPKNKFEEVIETALATWEVCKKCGLPSFCKTSGASGLHVYIPLKNVYPYDQVRDFAHVLASIVQEQVPDFTSLERSLKKRGDKIYVDWLQNRSGQTLSSVYSVRPVEGAHVSTPLEWKEVNNKLHPGLFDITNITKRVEKKGDLFQDVLTQKADLKKALKLLSG